MPKLTMSDVLGSSTPYLDVFGVEQRTKGRPTGAALDYKTSLELPDHRIVPNRSEAQAIRSKIKHRATAVLMAIHAEELRTIYRAELAIELEKYTPGAGKGSPKRLSEEQAKEQPGSGFLPGETYWDWMETFVRKDDSQWALEKPVVRENIKRIQKGG